jgi:tetratricopeptide (TPR) repeat protein
MQQVTAFSRPQTVPAAPAVPAKSSMWILSSWRDLLLYVGTPLLLLPMFALAQAKWSAQDIYIFVAAFGAMGHHLPGMIRAYGDRALFERFRWRFIFAPIFLLGTCVAFYWWDLKGIILIVFFWGVWHGMMQTYGFCRIYDAKMGSFAALSRRIDFATCGIWFAAGVLLSPARMGETIDLYYSSGAPFIQPWLFRGMQQGVLALAIGVTVLFLAHFAWTWAHGKRQNPVKLALLASSVAFWWYCNNGVTNILAGIALFEVFHDVQYLSLVWIYNRNRVEKDSSIGGFMRFVFRRSGSLIGLYIGLVFAYGSLGFLNSYMAMETVTKVLTGVVAASGLLHFYYDGFIWKVREKATRQSLGLTGGTEAAPAGLVPSWALHGLKWALVFVLPLGALWLGQTYSKTTQLERSSWVVANFPSGASANFNHGLSLQDAGRLDEAVEHHRRALKADPNYTKAHVELAGVLRRQSKLDEAKLHFEKALALEPEDGEIRGAYAYLLERIGRNEEAAKQYEIAIRRTKNSPRVLYNYAAFLHKNSKLDEAITQYRRALKEDNNFADAHFDLGAAFFDKGELEQARHHFMETARIQPRRADVQVNLGSVFLQQGQLSQAIIHYEEALRIDPNSKPAQESLRYARTTENRFRSR